jgi:Flp pilus assembly protein CpaB
MQSSLPQQALPQSTPAPKPVIDPAKSRRKGWILSLAAFILASLAGTLAARHLGQLEAELGAKQQIVVAAKVIPAQAVITPDMVTIQELPVKYMAPTYFQNIADVVDGETTAKIDISPGEYIQQNMVAQNAGLDKGMVPITIDVSPKTSSNNSVRQGNYVDILISYKDEQKRPTTRYLLQKIKVLAVDNLLPAQGGSGDDTYLPAGSEGEVRLRQTRYVTLEVTKEQAVLVTYADNFAGELRLIIRRPDDQATPNIPAVHFIGGDEDYKGGGEDDTALTPESGVIEAPGR